MIKRGLVQELEDFHKNYNEREEKDYTRGIFQSIGFKEFHNYLMLSDEDKKSNNGKKLLQEGVDLLKLVTRRYARKQIKWISNRFLSSDRNGPPVYALDVTDVSKWDSNVRDPAFTILQAHIDGTSCDYSPVPLKISERNEKKNFYCETCQIHLNGTAQWEIHIHGNKHKKKLKSIHKLKTFNNKVE